MIVFQIINKYDNMQEFIRSEIRLIVQNTLAELTRKTISLRPADTALFDELARVESPRHEWVEGLLSGFFTSLLLMPDHSKSEKNVQKLRNCIYLYSFQQLPHSIFNDGMTSREITSSLIVQFDESIKRMVDFKSSNLWDKEKRKLWKLDNKKSHNMYGLCVLE